MYRRDGGVLREGRAKGTRRDVDDGGGGSVEGDDGVRDVGEDGARDVGDEGIWDVGEGGTREVDEDGTRDAGDDSTLDVVDEETRDAGDRDVREGACGPFGVVGGGGTVGIGFGTALRTGAGGGEAGCCLRRRKNFNRGIDTPPCVAWAWCGHKQTRWSEQMAQLDAASVQAMPYQQGELYATGCILLHSAKIGIVGIRRTYPSNQFTSVKRSLSRLGCNEECWRAAAHISAPRKRHCGTTCQCYPSSLEIGQPIGGGSQCRFFP